MFKNLREIFALFAVELLADESCARCGAIFSRHGWQVLDHEDGSKEIVPVMPACPDGSGRTYARR
jgi:hypothetical protein